VMSTKSSGRRRCPDSDEEFPRRRHPIAPDVAMNFFLGTSRLAWTAHQAQSSAAGELSTRGLFLHPRTWWRNITVIFEFQRWISVASIKSRAQQRCLFLPQGCAKHLQPTPRAKRRRYFLSLPHRSARWRCSGLMEGEGGVQNFGLYAPWRSPCSGNQTASTTARIRRSRTAGQRKSKLGNRCIQLRR
jgi:hypothetical protein